MRTRILLFAGLREKFQRSELYLEIPKGSRVKEVLDILWADPKEAKRYTRCLLFAVNQVYVRPDAPLKEGDELAILPPVAGG